MNEWSDASRGPLLPQKRPPFGCEPHLVALTVAHPIANYRRYYFDPAPANLFVLLCREDIITTTVEPLLDRALSHALHFSSRRALFAAMRNWEQPALLSLHKQNGGDHGPRNIALAYRRSNPDYHSAISLLALETEYGRDSKRSSDVTAVEPNEKREPDVAFDDPQKQHEVGTKYVVESCREFV
jgi:hypothetical protein